MTDVERALSQIASAADNSAWRSSAVKAAIDNLQPGGDPKPILQEMLHAMEIFQNKFWLIFIATRRFPVDPEFSRIIEIRDTAAQPPQEADKIESMHQFYLQLGEVASRLYRQRMASEELAPPEWILHELGAAVDAGT